MGIPKPKTISELKDYRFFVPSYQRGYRWTEDEVIALLDDINEFSTDGGVRYCLQPLIVKSRGDGTFEVVDGQQRLTTIYIFMKIAVQEIRSATPPFSLGYETRTDSAAFLEALSDDCGLQKDKNIDYYHMATAYETISGWLDKQDDKSVAIQKLNTKIRESVFFIWYEMPSDSDPINMFTKVNLGKIPLTNAELIKALLLNNDNFPKDTNENSLLLAKDNFPKDANKRQIEISLAWDRMEQGLRDDSFWYFLNEKEQSGTRIDLLFDLLAGVYNDELPAPITAGQNNFPFLAFSASLKKRKRSPDKEDFVKTLWGSVEKLYAEFRDWYFDLDKFHIIGYLIASGVKIAEIFTLTRGKLKSAVMKELLDKAESVSLSHDNLSALSYDNRNDRPKIRRLLLLFNIATLVCKSEKQYRFPFDIYKGGSGEKISWDIEHIHATADITDEPDGSLGNLTILERATNRTLGAKTFDEKRKIIIDRESKGLFVPLCTKNIFLKVYSSNLEDMKNWDDDDKKDYITAMENILKNFFSGSFRNERLYN